MDAKRGLQEGMGPGRAPVCDGGLFSSATAPDDCTCRRSIERHGSSAGPSRQGSLASRATLSQPHSSATSSRQHSLQGEEMDRLIAQQGSGMKGPSPPRPRSLELRGGASPPLLGTPSPPGTAYTRDEQGGLSPPPGMSTERRQTIAALSRQLSPNWNGRITGTSRQRSLERNRGGGSGPGSIHRVSSLDGRDVTVEVIDRAPGIDMEATQLARRHARSSLEQQRVGAERIRDGADTGVAVSEATATAERAEGPAGPGRGGDNRSVQLARRLEGRGTSEGPARGMASRQVLCTVHQLRCAALNLP